MRFLTLFTASLAIVLGMTFSAQAATLTMSTDKLTYGVSETITVTVIGDSAGSEKTDAIQGFIYDLNGNTTFDGTIQTQTALAYKTTYGSTDWANLTPLNLNPNMSFGQLAGITPTFNSIVNLTAVMTFHATSSGTANFAWADDGEFDSLNFFNLTTAAGTTVTIVPEPTTAGLMGLGLIGLAISGRRRKS